MRIGIVRDEWAEGLPLPGYATAGSAGMDLYAAIPENETLELLPGERRLIPTGLHVAIPSGYEGQVRARSGLALKHGIGLVNSPGTIDSDYRGELRVLVMNHGTESYSFRRGDRIAQLVISPVVRAELAEEDDSDFWETARGAGGFGSTGFGTNREQAGAEIIGA